MGAPSTSPAPPRTDLLDRVDVASSDGFWAFEMARRGAASVLSYDLAEATRQDWRGDLGRLVVAAGFTVERAGGLLWQPFGARAAPWPRPGTSGVRTHGVRAAAAYWFGLRRFGVPTSWVLVRPGADGVA